MLEKMLRWTFERLYCVMKDTVLGWNCWCRQKLSPQISPWIQIKNIKPGKIFSSYNPPHFDLLAALCRFKWVFLNTSRAKIADFSFFSKFPLCTLDHMLCLKPAYLGRNSSLYRKTSNFSPFSLNSGRFFEKGLQYWFYLTHCILIQ